MKQLFIILILITANIYAVTDSPVTSVEGLIYSIESANADDTIYIGGDVILDLTDEETIVIDKTIRLIGVINSGMEPPRLLTRGKKTILKIEADNVTIENIDFEGSQKDSKKKEILAYNKKNNTTKGVYQYPATRGIHVTADFITIRNSELFGFSHAAIFAESSRNLLVENCNLHHNQRWGLGYGVSLHLDSTAKIINNVFDYNRHSIAGSGSPGQSYEAAYNEFGSHHQGPPLDMHGGKDRKDGTNIAGDTIYIHDNIIKEANHYVFYNRGIAQNKVIIENNLIAKRWRRSCIGYYNVTKKQVPKSKFIFRKNKRLRRKD